MRPWLVKTTRPEDRATKRATIVKCNDAGCLLCIHHDFLFWIASEARNKFRYRPESLFFSFGAIPPALLRQSHDISQLYTHLSSVDVQ